VLAAGAQAERIEEGAGALEPMATEPTLELLHPVAKEQPSEQQTQDQDGELHGLTPARWQVE
jgi:hypothetical protein